MAAAEKADLAPSPRRDLGPRTTLKRRVALNQKKGTPVNRFTRLSLKNIWQIRNKSLKLKLENLWLKRRTLISTLLGQDLHQSQEQDLRLSLTLLCQGSPENSIQTTWFQRIRTTTFLCKKKWSRENSQAEIRSTTWVSVELIRWLSSCLSGCSTPSRETPQRMIQNSKGIPSSQRQTWTSSSPRTLSLCMLLDTPMASS